LKAALALIFISLAFEIASGAIDPSTLGFEAGMERPELVFMAAILVVLFGLFFALVFCVWRGHRWARIVYSALTVLGVIASLVDLPSISGQPPGYRVLYLLAIAADSATVIVLFMPATNSWFLAARAARLAR
jgi:hypothetical protein